MTENAVPPRHVVVPDRLKTIKRHTPAVFKQVARASLRRYGVRTASSRPLPTFLVIGTKRGGTTSLWNWLLKHPAVAPQFPAAQQIKSPHYFDINFWRGEQWYRSHFPTQQALDRLAATVGGCPAVGEASPYYMFHPAAPQRVAALMPDVRLIVLLRDPVARAYSNFAERRGSGAEPLTVFEDALEAESTRLDGEEAKILADPRYYSAHHDSHTYLARGRYIEHFRPWLDAFPRDQMLIIRSEDQAADPAAAFALVQQFLGIPLHDIVDLQRHNRLPRNPIKPETERWLADYYRPYNAQLYEALGRDFGWDDLHPNTTQTP
jgi:hypothetical protein